MSILYEELHVLADVDVDDQWHSHVNVLIELLHVFDLISQLLHPPSKRKLGAEVLLMAVFMHKFHAAYLHWAHASEDSDLLVVIFMVRALSDVLFKV